MKIIYPVKDVILRFWILKKNSSDNIVNTDNLSANFDNENDDKSHRGSCSASHEDLSTYNTLQGGVSKS